MQPFVILLGVSVLTHVKLRLPLFFSHEFSRYLEHTLEIFSGYLQDFTVLIYRKNG